MLRIDRKQNYYRATSARVSGRGVPEKTCHDTGPGWEPHVHKGNATTERTEWRAGTHQLWEGPPQAKVTESFQGPPSVTAGFSGSNTHKEGLKKQWEVVISGST